MRVRGVLAGSARENKKWSPEGLPFGVGGRDGVSPGRFQGVALAGPDGIRAAALKERGLYLNAAGGGVGEYEASAESKRGAGGFHRVAAGGDVVHEIGLPKCQGFAIAGKMVLIWRYGAKCVLVALALGLNRLDATNGFDNLSSGTITGDETGKPGVGVGVAGAVRDGNKPAGAGNKRGHFAGGGVEVRRWAGGCFNGIGKAAGLGLRKGKLAVALTRIFAGGKYIHGKRAAPLSGARPVVVNLRPASSR